jgi:RHS repeat-associated protein
VIDAHNHTGYAQVLKEIGDSNTVYVLGRDVLAQAVGSADPEYLLYDAHGSVRALADTGGSITEKYAFDAYGDLLDFSGSPSTSLLYSGEMRDPYTLDYFLRSRWYKPGIGRFNRLDEFAGNTFDPQSFHKYLYAHANPVTNRDPSGRITSIGDVLAAVGLAALIMATIYMAFNFGEGLYLTARGRSGTCGEDVTQDLRDLAAQFDRIWPQRPGAENGFECTYRFSPVKGWDILPLFNKKVGGATGRCKGTATVSGKCYDQSAINYYLWGKICKYCGDTETQAIDTVHTWKILRGGEWLAVQQAYGFTKAGYRGWVQSFDRVPLSLLHHDKCTPNMTTWDGSFVGDFHWGGPWSLD